MKVSDKYIGSQVRGAIANALANGNNEIMTWTVDQLYCDLIECGGIEQELPEDKVKRVIISVFDLNRALLNHNDHETMIRNLKGSPL